MASSSVWGNFALYSLSAVMFVLGFVTPWWIDYGGDSKGLWMKCQKPHTIMWQCHTINPQHESSNFKTVQAMMVLGLACYVIMFFMFMVVIRSKRQDMRMITYVGILAALFSLIALVIFGAVIYWEASGLLNWSYIIVAASCPIITIVTIATYAMSAY